MKTLSTAILLLAMADTAICSEQIIAIGGELQLWKRQCDEELSCGLPEALTEKISIEGTVKRPAVSSQLGIFHQVIDVNDDVNDFSITFDTYWKIAASQTDKGYLAHQHKLVFNSSILVAECSQYQTDEATLSFPVGMCSGYVHGDSSVTQYGITFYKRYQ